MTTKDLHVLIDNLDEYIHVPGGIERLKKTVLYLAVSGKIVPQNPTEGTGEELYRLIQIEKKKLTQEGGVRKRDVLQDVTVNEIPFDIPTSWKWAKLGNLINDISGGGTPSKANSAFWGGDIPWASIKDLNVTLYLHDTQDHITEAGCKSKPNILKPAGSILIGTRMGLGKIAITNKTVAINQDLKAVSLSDRFNKEFFINFYKTLTIKGTGTTVNGITQDKLLEIPVPVPPLAEQRRIVEKIDAVFALIDDLAVKYAEEEEGRQRLAGVLLGSFSNRDNHRALELLPELIRGRDDTWWLRNFILHQTTSGRLVPQNVDDGTADDLYENILHERAKDLSKHGAKLLPGIDPGEEAYALPESWKWVRLGDVTNYGKTEKCKPADLALDTWVLELEDIEKTTSRLVSKVLVKARRPSSDKNIFRKGDVLYGKLRPYLDKVIVADSDGVCSSEILPIRSYGNSIHPDYLLLILKSPNFIATVNEMTYGVKMPRLGTEDGRKMLIPLAPYAEQVRIVEKATWLLGLVSNLELAFDSPVAVPNTVPTKDNKWWFALKQGIGTVLDRLSQTQYERGEMVIAKYMYFLQEIYKVPFGLQFVKHQFGPYDPDIKKAIMSSAFNKDKFFMVKGTGAQQVFSLGGNSATLMRYTSDTLSFSQTSLDELMKYTANAKSRDIERLATVCKIIQDSQSDDEQVVIDEMKKWKNDKFMPEEVKKSLLFIRQQDWHKKLLK